MTHQEYIHAKWAMFFLGITIIISGGLLAFVLYWWQGDPSLWPFLVIPAGFGGGCFLAIPAIDLFEQAWHPNRTKDDER